MTAILGRFQDKVLFDYPPHARRVWWLCVVAGAFALAVAVFLIVGRPAAYLSTAIAIASVLVAGRFPLAVPRTKLVFSGSDIFLYGTLVFVGAPAAVVAAGIDSLMGVVRRSKRLSSRLVSPSTSMAGMLAAGSAFAGLQSLAEGTRWAEGVTLLAVAVAGLLHHVFNAGALQRVVAAKQGLKTVWRDWFRDTAWMAGVTVLSAFLGGLLVLTSTRVGVGSLGVAAAVVLAVTFLIHLSLSRIEADRVEQEQRVAAAQESARINQQRFTAAFEHAAGGLAIAGGDGSVLRVNRAFCELLQGQRQAFVGSRFEELLNADDRHVLVQRLAELRGVSDAVVSLEVRMGRPMGEVWVSLHASLFEDPGASGTGLIYQLHDISDRRAPRISCSTPPTTTA